MATDQISPTETTKPSREVVLEGGPPGAPQRWRLDDVTADRIAVPYHGRHEHYLRVASSMGNGDLPVFRWGYRTWPAE